MPPKDILDQIKVANGLTEIIDQLTEPVAKEMAEHLSPNLRPGEMLPDLELIQRLMGRQVVARLQILIAAEEVYNRAAIEIGAESLEPLDSGDLDLGFDGE